MPLDIGEGADLGTFQEHSHRMVMQHPCRLEKQIALSMRVNIRLNPKRLLDKDALSETILNYHPVVGYSIVVCHFAV